MKHSENYNFYLPSRDTDVVVDILPLSAPFETIEQELYKIGKDADFDKS